jgi:hypothetical protein
VVRRRRLAAIFLVSFSVILCEILLTRIFSVMLLYHFAYVAISLALLGLSLGALLVHYRPNLHAETGIERTLAFYGGAYGLSVLLCVLSLLHFQPEGVQLFAGLNLPTIRYLGLTYAVAALPFALSGVCVSSLLAAGRKTIGRYYALDLLGAAAGAIAVIPVAEQLGAPSGMLVAAFAGCAAGAVGGGRARSTAVPVASGVLVVLVYAASLETGVLDLRYSKGRLEQNVLIEKWNSFSRVTAVAWPNAVDLLIDSGASTAIYPASVFARLAVDHQTPAMHLRPDGDILIIGSGGGRDVAAAATIGLRSITGVEINPIVVELATKRFRHLAGDLYDRPNVRIVTDEGRSFLTRVRERYDVLMLTMVDTWAATAAGSFSLSENNLYTVEAFASYLDHLESDGILSITRWYFPRRPHETLRLLALGRAALARDGIDGHHRHLVVIGKADFGSGTPLPFDQAPQHRATFLLKKTPFEDDELTFLERMVGQNRAWRFIYSPRGSDPSIFAELAETDDLPALYAGYEFDVTPPTDDRPFFFFVVRAANLIASFRDDFFRLPDVTNIGVFLLVGSFAADALFVVLIFSIPLIARAPRPRFDRRGVAPALVYFSCLGAGFMLVEVALMQTFIRFLGHPTFALTVVLFVLLLAGGVGSLYCGTRSDAAVAQWLPRWLAAVVALGLVYTFGLP